MSAAPAGPQAAGAPLLIQGSSAGACLETQKFAGETLIKDEDVLTLHLQICSEPKLYLAQSSGFWVLASGFWLLGVSPPSLPG